MWDEITYPFPNFNGATVEVCEWMTNFILHLTEYVIIIHARTKANIFFSKMGPCAKGKQSDFELTADTH